MCRMLAAVGRFEPAALVGALRSMASNESTGHDQEYRAEGAAHRHEDGWGAAWLEGGVLHRRRRAVSCLTDRRIEEIAPAGTEMLLLHARRASSGAVEERNTHPFVATFGGREWAFCHNGTIHDESPLVAARGLVPEGTTDSERLFHHLLARFDADDPVTSLREALEPVRDFTAMNAFLANAGRVFAIAWPHREVGQPKHYTLWEGWGPGRHIVSSEPVSGVGCTTWWPVPAGRIIPMEPLRRTF